jgi:hypothetical protein
MFHKRRKALSLAVIVAVLAACGDTLPSAPGAAVLTPPGDGAPLRTLSEEDAFATADPYYARDVLAPFGSAYDEFFLDPEAITDGEFEAKAPYFIADWEIDVEGDCAGCLQQPTAGGAPYATDEGGEVFAAMPATCEQQWERCWNRCRRIIDSRARALCWAGCAAAYALCVRRRRGG